MGDKGLKGDNGTLGNEGPKGNKGIQYMHVIYSVMH